MLEKVVFRFITINVKLVNCSSLKNELFDAYAHPAPYCFFWLNAIPRCYLPIPRWRVSSCAAARPARLAPMVDAEGPYPTR